MHNSLSKFVDENDAGDIELLSVMCYSLCVIFLVVNCRRKGTCAVTILLADTSDVWTGALKEQLICRHTVLICNNGNDVIPMLLDHHPDILVLDLMLPGIDGMSILRAIRTSALPVRVLVTSVMYPAYVLHALESLDVSFALQKPCPVCTVISHINAIAHYSSQEDESKLDTILLLLGFRMSLVGYKYIREAIRMMRDNPGQSITKELYPGIAQRCGGNDKSVERAIRTVIQNAWERRDERIWCAYFPKNRNGKITMPSNRDFVVRMAECDLLNKKAC